MLRRVAHGGAVVYDVNGEVAHPPLDILMHAYHSPTMLVECMRAGAGDMRGGKGGAISVLRSFFSWNMRDDMEFE